MRRGDLALLGRMSAEDARALYSLLRHKAGKRANLRANAAAMLRGRIGEAAGNPLHDPDISEAMRRIRMGT